MTTLDFTRVLLDFKGSPMKDGTGLPIKDGNGQPMLDKTGQPVTDGTGEPLTALIVATVTLTATINGDVADGKKKFERGLLLQKIYANKEAADLVVTERSELQELSGKIFPTSIMFPFWKFIEGS